MLDITKRAGVLTFEIKTEAASLAISCVCIKGIYMELIVNEFQNIVRMLPKDKEVKREMERPI